MARRKAPQARSVGEETLALQLRATRHSALYAREYVFHPERKWRFDFAWPAAKVAVEIDGGLGGNGRHSRADGAAKDCEKRNEAVLLGWRVLRVTTAQVRSGAALRWIEKAMATESLKDLARKVVAQLEDGFNDSPTHLHACPGVWGAGSTLAGQPCEWCAIWKRFKQEALR